MSTYKQGIERIIFNNNSSLDMPQACWQKQRFLFTSPWERSELPFSAILGEVE